MPERSERNPPWSRDELILGLDAYFSVQPRSPDPKLPQIGGLSDLLREMARRENRDVSSNFRSPASGVMTLMNFRSFDPGYEGKGLEAAGAADRLVWEELSGNRTRLQDLAQAIRAGYRALGFSHPAGDPPDVEIAVEGEMLTRMHV